jgi:hypothetical protein
LHNNQNNIIEYHNQGGNADLELSAPVQHPFGAKVLKDLGIDSNKGDSRSENHPIIICFFSTNM